MLDGILNYLLPLIQSALASHPWLIVVVTIMGTARVIFKPLMTLLEAIADVTPSTKDNEFLAKVKASKPYAIISYLFDYFASIKLPKSDGDSA